MKQTDERKQAILDILADESKIYVVDLSQRFAVSEVTIRKDLQELEERGALRRVHGGAIALRADRVAVESCLDELGTICIPEKKAIAQTAYGLIADGDALILDASTTTLELSHLLRDGPRKDLTIITPALQVSMDLTPCEHIQVIQIGGLIRRSLYTSMGPMTTEALKSLHADKAFIGVNGIDPQVGLTTQNILECETKRYMIESSTQAFVLADSSKMGCIALGVIAPLSRIDFVVTDSRIQQEFVHRMEECGVDVVIASLKDSDAR